jgi:hypothetical protein
MMQLLTRTLYCPTFGGTTDALTLIGVKMFEVHDRVGCLESGPKMLQNGSSGCMTRHPSVTPQYTNA